MTGKPSGQVADVEEDGGVPVGAEHESRDEPEAAEPGTVDTDAVDTEAESGESAGTVRRRRWVPATRAGRYLAAAAALMLLAVAAGGAWWQLAGLPDGAALRYGATVVSVDELDQRANTLRALYGVEAPEDPAAADGFRRDVAKSMAVSLILDRAAADRGIVVGDKQVSDTLARYIEQGFGAGGRDAFVRALGNVGSSEEAVREEVRRQLAVGLLMRDVAGPVTVSDAELRAAYDERRDSLGTPERRTLRNIVVATEEEARAALDGLRAGTPFEEVAARRSLDAATRDSGGLLGDLARADLEQAVGDAAFGVAARELYGPVQGRFGWNVGRVDAVTPFVPAEFDQIAEQLRQALELERTLAAWRDWLGATIRDADVEYADAFRPSDPDAPPSFGPAGTVPEPAPR